MHPCLLIFVTLATIPGGLCGRILANALSAFGGDISQKLTLVTNNHFVLSPMSLWSLLATISEGATGSTKLELQKLLRLTQGELESYRMYERLSEINRPTCIYRIGLLAYDTNYPITEEYIIRVQNMKTMKILKLNMDSPDSAFDLNHEIYLATALNVSYALPNDYTINKDLVIVDAMYFRALWTYRPTTNDIEEFEDEFGKLCGCVPMMGWRGRWIKSSYNELLNMHLTELKFTMSNPLLTMIILQANGTHFKNILSNLTDWGISYFYSAVSRIKERRLNFYFPEFYIATQYNKMEQILRGLGVREMFEHNANFTIITKEIDNHTKFRVKNVYQAASFRTDLNGGTGRNERRQLFLPSATKPRAPPGAPTRSRCPPNAKTRQTDRNQYETIYVRRPFVFVVADLRHNYIHYMGSYYRPPK